jgi:hypothetical protein
MPKLAPGGFFYNGVVPMPGNHFVVRVNDETGETSFMPGR